MAEPTSPRALVSDAEIAAFLGEGKPLPVDFLTQLKPKREKGVQREAELALTGDQGTEFQIFVRQSVVKRQGKLTPLRH